LTDDTNFEEDLLKNKEKGYLMFVNTNFGLKILN